MSADLHGVNLRRSDRKAIEDRPAWILIGGNKQQVEVKDMSAEGACFIMSRPIRVRKAVRFQIGYGADMQECDAVVVRCAMSPVGSYEVAVRFDVADAALAARFGNRVSPTINIEQG